VRESRAKMKSKAKGRRKIMKYDIFKITLITYAPPTEDSRGDKKNIKYQIRLTPQTKKNKNE
jgi:hypothetical protein